MNRRFVLIALFTFIVTINGFSDQGIFKVASTEWRGGSWSGDLFIVFVSEDDPYVRLTFAKSSIDSDITLLQGDEVFIRYRISRWVGDRVYEVKLLKTGRGGK